MDYNKTYVEIGLKIDYNSNLIDWPENNNNVLKWWKNCIFESIHYEKAVFEALKQLKKKNCCLELTYYNHAKHLPDSERISASDC